MERAVKVIFLIAAMSIAVSCHPLSECDKTYRYHADSYIYGYISVKSISLSSVEGNSEMRVFINPRDSYGAFSEDKEDQQRYMEKCEYYGDTGYDLSKWTLHKGVYGNCVQDRDYTSIRIYSNKRYSESLPAGSDLSGCFYMASRSPYKFIASGYKDKAIFQYSSYPEYYQDCLNGTVVSNYQIGGGLHPVYGLLSEMSEDDLKLLGMCEFNTVNNPSFDVIRLYIARLPEDMSVHTITMEITDTDGNVLKAETKMDFSKVQKVW